ncbi:hypothetical protein [Streptomyces lutosisoli]|uniref:Uncharacterized protein n=1 Tax=Streptomyces lutosisoli TaxID=2665721 RepID=A0ABW2VYV6_9ACTN
MPATVLHLPTDPTEVRDVATTETPFITELVAALGHLENAVQLAATPAKLHLPNGATVSKAQMRVWVTQNTARIRFLLEQLADPSDAPQK